MRKVAIPLIAVLIIAIVYLASILFIPEMNAVKDNDKTPTEVIAKDDKIFNYAITLEEILTLLKEGKFEKADEYMFMFSLNLKDLNNPELVTYFRKLFNKVEISRVKGEQTDNSILYDIKYPDINYHLSKNLAIVDLIKCVDDNDIEYVEVKNVPFILINGKVQYSKALYKALTFMK